MNSYIGEPHLVLAKIRHDELVAEAQHFRRLRELRAAEDRSGRENVLRHSVRRISTAFKLLPPERSQAPYTARPTS